MTQRERIRIGVRFRAAAGPDQDEWTVTAVRGERITAQSGDGREHDVARRFAEERLAETVRASGAFDNDP